jgi:hypothetical protein
MTLVFCLLATAFSVTPIQKVITMMEEMATKGAAEKAAEAETFKAYSKWCDQTTFDKGVAIRDGKMAIEKAVAAAGKAQADAVRLADEVTELDQNINMWNVEKATAEQARTAEHAEYEKVHAEESEAIDAMAQAISSIAAAGGSFLQNTKEWNKLTAMAKENRHLASFLQEVPTGEVSTYDSSSGSTTDAVKMLQGKMEEQRSRLEKEETEHKFAFEELDSQLVYNIETATSERDSKSEQRAQRLGDHARETDDAAASSATLKNDEEYMADLTAQCQTKAGEFDDRQQMRQEELEAIAKAIDIMSSGTVSGAAAAHLPSFGLRASSVQSVQSAKRVAAFLRVQAEQTNSRILLSLANKVSTTGHFDKVKQMIVDMIEKLTASAAEEADHKEWCDTELKSNKQTRDEKTNEVNRLTARSDQLNAQMAQLTTELEELADGISTLSKTLSEATDARETEKAENEKAIADAQAAIPAVRKALTVLKDFYAKAATATSLVQAGASGPADEAPGSWDTPYQGMGGSKTGVVGMLEVILSDFTRLESETSSSEAEAQTAFEKFSSDSNADIAAKKDSTLQKERLKMGADRDLVSTSKDLKSTQKELDAALEYHDKLKPSCVDAGVSYSERAQRRQAEIESLQEALKILGAD